MSHCIEKCTAPICSDDPLKEETVWHPDEPICQKFPKQNWQKKQESLEYLVRTGRHKDKGEGWRIADLMGL